MALQFRRDTAANFVGVTLAAGEPAYETDTGRAKIGDGSTTYASLPFLEKVAIPFAISNETDALTNTGNPKLTYYMPAAFTLTDIHACVTTAPVGSSLIIDVNDSGTTIMTTNKLVIDAGTNDTTAAATGPTLTDTALAEGAAITFDIDQVGSSTAGAGAKVTLLGYWT